MAEQRLSGGWEGARAWDLVRPIVYYQRENFIPRGIVGGARVVDFSAGLGDLSAYVSTLGPAQLVATAPEPDAPRAPDLPDDADWAPGVGAATITQGLGPDSADVVLARMVIQFPTVEQHNVDVDEMLGQWHEVLAPGGTLVASTHSFFSMPAPPVHHDDVEIHLAAIEGHNQQLLESNDEYLTSIGEQTAGLVELVRYLDLPPREGPLGETGFGLKTPMLVNSFVRSGFSVQSVEMIEPFTFPIGLRSMLADGREELASLGRKVIDIKKTHLTTADASDTYKRPGQLRSMLSEVQRLVPVVSVPIVRVWAQRP